MKNMHIILNTSMKYKKTIVAALAVAVVSVALGASFNTSSQHLQAATSNYALTINSPTTDLSSYFKSAYQTRASLELGLTPSSTTVGEGENNQVLKCEDVLLDTNDVDACILAYSLIQSDNLRSNLSYAPTSVETLNLDGSITENGWNSISDWFRVALRSLTGLEDLTIKNYKGTNLFDLSSNNALNSLSIDGLVSGASKEIFSTTSTSLKDLNVENSNLTSLSDVSLDRFRGLENLNLSNNSITSLTYQSGTETFNISQLSRIKTILLSNNEITDVAPIFSVTSEERGLLSLDLSRNNLTNFTTIGNRTLTISSPNSKINLSNNNITSTSNFFSRIRFSSSLSASSSALTSVDLSSNKLTELPSEAAKVSRKLILKDNNINSFSQLESDAKLENLIINEDDVNKKIWEQDIYNNGSVTNINDNYVKWLITPGENDDNGNEQLSSLQVGYVNDVLIKVGISLLNVNLKAENTNVKEVTEEDLSSPLLGDLKFSRQSVIENVITPTSTAELSNFINSTRTNINGLLSKAYTGYEARQRLLQEKEDNTSTGLSPTIVGVIIALSIIGILAAAGFIGFYFFNLNKKAKKRGEF